MSFNPLDSLFDDLQNVINDCQTDVSSACLLYDYVIYTWFEI